MSERQGSIWNAVALVATLALAAVVAVVAVSRTDRPTAEPSPSPGASASPSPSPTSAEPLAGEGPFIVYAGGDGTVSAFDTSSGRTIPLGRTTGAPVTRYPMQPEAGRLVSFASVDGGVWRVSRRGLAAVGRIKVPADSFLVGSAISLDDRRLAVGVSGPEPHLLIVDLASGRVDDRPRTRRGVYPDETLVPIGWSLGGTLVYQVPWCECDAVAPGLYAYDVAARSSALVTGTATTHLLFNGVLTPSGQAAYFGTATPRRCRVNEVGSPCTGPPYALRRIAAGRAGASTLRRSNESSFTVRAMSVEGRFVILERLAVGAREGFELADADGDAVSGSILRGIPARSVPLALLPGDHVVAEGVDDSGGVTVVVVRGGVVTTLAGPTPATDPPPRYLGWLR